MSPYPEALTRPAFDALAAGYDDSFTQTHIGRLMRAAVWSRIDHRFLPGHRVLELNCGTGEDAVHLAKRCIAVLATDISPEMVRIALAKTAHYGLTSLVDVRRLSWEELDTLDEPLFDGFLSNFGGINCVQDIASVIPSLARCLKFGAVGFICAMGPYSVWEWIWFLLHADPHRAFRRLTRGGVNWRGIRVRYPSIDDLTRVLSPALRVRSVTALGVLLPPPFAESLAARFPAAIGMLNRCERRFETLPLLSRLADHYVLEFERTRAVLP